MSDCFLCYSPITFLNNTIYDCLILSIQHKGDSIDTVRIVLAVFFPQQENTYIRLLPFTQIDLLDNGDHQSTALHIKENMCIFVGLYYNMFSAE